MIGSGKQTAGGGERQADRWFVVKAVGRPLWVAVGRPLEKATYQTSSGTTTCHYKLSEVISINYPKLSEVIRSYQKLSESDNTYQNLITLIKI